MTNVPILERCRNVGENTRYECFTADVMQTSFHVSASRFNQIIMFTVT